MGRFVLIAVFLGVAACSGGEINTNRIDVDRLPIDDNGNFFLGRTLEW